MNFTDIERKFLVENTDFIYQSYKSTVIIQAYLNSDPLRTVRVRIKGEKSYLTIKGKSEDGISRFEWEKEIPLSEAHALLPLCEPFPIEKTRYEVLVGQSLWEVDVFHGKNQGLILAEIELKDTEATFEKPDWIGKEVTAEACYYNSYLSKHPYNEWKSPKNTQKS